MEPINSSQIIDSTIVVTLGSSGDLLLISLLNNKYLFENVTQAELLNGFIKVQYSSKQLSEIIKAAEIAVAKVNDNLIGYYLIGGSSDNELLVYQQLAAGRFAKSKSIDVFKIGYGVQICIDAPYHNKGLFSNMLHELVNNVSHKYDYLLCSVSDENSKSLKIHLKSGWELFEQFEGKNILIYKITTLGA